MQSRSILHAADQSATAPSCFRDLNLDQVIASITKGKEEYDLAPFFQSPLQSEEAVVFRQAVFRDFEDSRFLDAVRAFAKAMQTVRSRLRIAEKSSNAHHAGLWFLQAISAYGEAAISLCDELKTVSSEGLQSFRNSLKAYVESSSFRALFEPARRLLDEVAQVRYTVVMIGLYVEVRPYAEEEDYSKKIQDTFERFEQSDHVGFQFDLRDGDISQVELNILNGIAHLNEDLFALVAAHKQANSGFIDDLLQQFDRHIQFYVAYCEYMAQFELPFCYPAVSRKSKKLDISDAFDLALAGKLRAQGEQVVLNDVSMHGGERMIVVSGPNQGGKTTFARMVGQLHYLASLGCPIPGRSAALFLPDQIFTHFERQEKMINLRGKLEDDILRIHEILAAATPDSLIIVNEIFASTALRDAIFLSERVAQRIHDLDSICVWVTFIEELASLPGAVSYVSRVNPEDPAIRTFRVVRVPADGLAYAMSIAQKYGLTYDAVKERIRG